jgi:outer membrane protein
MEWRGARNQTPVRPCVSAETGKTEKQEIRNMKGFSLTSSILMLAFAAGPAWSADLLEIYREATLQDAVYASAKAQYIAAQERIPQARALLLPNINFGAGANYNDLNVDYKNSTFASGHRDFYDYNYGVTLTQPLYRPQNAATYEQAKIQVRQAQTQLGSAAQDLMLRVAQARYDLVVAQELGAQNEVEVKNRALEVLVGKPAGVLAGLTTPVTLNPPQPTEMDAWVEQAYQSSLQIALAQQSVELAAREIERASAGHRPTVDAVGSLSQNYANSSAQGIGTDIRALVVGVQLNVPLYQGGAISSRVREAVANQERARQDLENARRSVALQTRQAYLGVTSGLGQVKALQQAVASTQLQLESTKLGQEVGVRTAVDVLNAEQQLSIARTNLAQAVYNTILNQLRLKAAVGKLAEADLADINALLKDGNS